MEYKDGFLINVQYVKQILAESVLYVEHFRCHGCESPA